MSEKSHKPVYLETTTPIQKVTWIAGGSSVAKLLSIPKVIREISKEQKGYLKPFLEIDDILYNDNAGGSSFPKLVQFTVELINTTPADRKQEVLGDLKLHVCAKRISKLNAFKYNKGGYIDKTVKRYGNFTEQSRFIKVPAEAVDLKLDLLDEYEKWIDNELKDMRMKTDSVSSYEKFKQIYDREVTPEKIEALQKRLLGFPSDEEKLNFLQVEKFNYLNRISSEVIETSGTTHFPNIPAGTPLFFDRIIQNEIDKINTLQKIGISERSDSAISGHLKDYFHNDESYTRIMEILINKGYVQAQSNVWIDQKKGNKGLLIGILKQLHSLGYFRQNKRPTKQELAAIAKETFGVEISLDRIKAAHAKDFDLSFLPVAAI